MILTQIEHEEFIHAMRTTALQYEKRADEEVDRVAEKENEEL